MESEEPMVGTTGSGVGVPGAHLLLVAELPPLSPVR